jgi:hypothetical protein
MRVGQSGCGSPCMANVTLLLAGVNCAKPSISSGMPSAGQLDTRMLRACRAAQQTQQEMREAVFDACYVPCANTGQGDIYVWQCTECLPRRTVC